MLLGGSVVLWTVVVLPFTYLIYAFLKFYINVRRRASYIHKFPGVPPHPLWGHIHEFPGPDEAGLRYLLERCAAFTKCAMSFYTPLVPAIAVYHPDTAKALLQTADVGEAGLRFMREQWVITCPRMTKTFFGPFIHTFPGPTELGLAWMRQFAEKGPRGLMKIWYGPFISTVSVYHPDTIKLLLKTAEPKPREFGGYKLVYPWLGDGLLLSKGAKWARNRRLLTPAFHFDILRPYMTVNNQCTDVLLNKWSKYSERGEYFEVFTHISLLTLDIILRCAFSYDNDCQIRGESHPYVKAISYLQETATNRLLQPWLYPDPIFFMTSKGRQFRKDCDFVHNISQEIIDDRRKALAQGTGAKRSGKYLDFLDILLTAKDEDKKGLINAEIRDECDTFLFEGHDTTSSGISWALFSLASNPEHQIKCQEEIDEVLAGRDTDDIVWDDLPKLKYLTMCIKEALRLHTPVPFIERQTTKDMYVDGYFLPSGTVVDIHLYVLHHNPLVWEEPMEYRPDRFLPENIEKKDNYAFVPFSAGPRNCIGQHFAMHEMKVAIARILRRFTLELRPDFNVEHRIAVVMKTEKGMFMKAVPRTPSA